MQAIILAAGMGSRLKEHTKDIPKAMIKIHDKPLIFHALDCLSKNNIDEVIIVVGYKKDIIIDAIGDVYNGMKIRYVENDIYDKTNNIYSLYITKDFVNEDVLLLECDLYYPEKIINLMVNSTDICNILVSKFNRNTMNGTVVRIDENNNVTELIVKKNQYVGFNYDDTYKTVNIYKFSKDFFLKKYIPSLKNYMDIESANSYYEFVLGALIYYANDSFKATIIDEKEWKEIDDTNDLKIAKKVNYE